MDENRTHILTSETKNEAVDNMDEDIKVKIIKKIGCGIMTGFHTTQDSVQWCVIMNILNSLYIS